MYTLKVFYIILYNIKLKGKYINNMYNSK